MTIYITYGQKKEEILENENSLKHLKLGLITDQLKKQNLRKKLIYLIILIILLY